MNRRDLMKLAGSLSVLFTSQGRRLFDARNDETAVALEPDTPVFARVIGTRRDMFDEHHFYGAVPEAVSSTRKHALRSVFTEAYAPKCRYSYDAPIDTYKLVRKWDDNAIVVWAPHDVHFEYLPDMDIEEIRIYGLARWAIGVEPPRPWHSIANHQLPTRTYGQSVSLCWPSYLARFVL